MIQINVSTNTTRRTVNAEITATPKQVFDDLGINTSSSMVNLNGNFLYAAEFNKPMSELGVEDGTTANINVVVKADGAAE